MGLRKHVRGHRLMGKSDPDDTGACSCALVAGLRQPDVICESFSNHESPI